jgi:1,6-anhydro-N-acetylmuramate kinase
MSGTSMDAVDVALVHAEGRGLELRATFERGATRPLGELSAVLRTVAGQEPAPAGSIAQAAEDLARVHVEVLGELLAGRSIDLIAVHGQTIYHAPPISWQLIHPSPIVRALGVPVVFDLRSADLAAGGQGAPITPLADWVLFRDTQQTRAIVNLGGFVNVTILPAGGSPAEVRGQDVCACNQLLDGIARQLFHQPYDEAGRRALQGVVRDEPLGELAALLRSQSSGDRSLGTGDELGRWVEAHRSQHAGEDLARTACAAVAGAIVGGVGRVDRLLLAGGGVRNQALTDEISARAACRVSLTDDLGVPTAYREASAMAVLGGLCQDRVPMTLPQVTHVPRPAPLAGCWAYP